MFFSGIYHPKFGSRDIPKDNSSLTEDDLRNKKMGGVSLTFEHQGTVFGDVIVKAYSKGTLTRDSVNSELDQSAKEHPIHSRIGEIIDNWQGEDGKWYCTGKINPGFEIMYDQIQNRGLTGLSMTHVETPEKPIVEVSLCETPGKNGCHILKTDSSLQALNNYMRRFKQTVSSKLKKKNMSDIPKEQVTADAVQAEKPQEENSSANLQKLLSRFPEEDRKEVAQFMTSMATQVNTFKTENEKLSSENKRLSKLQLSDKAQLEMLSKRLNTLNTQLDPDLVKTYGISTDDVAEAYQSEDNHLLKGLLNNLVMAYSQDAMNRAASSDREPKRKRVAEASPEEDTSMAEALAAWEKCGNSSSYSTFVE